jgi:hypothetical protein
MPVEQMIVGGVVAAMLLFMVVLGATAFLTRD